MGSVRGEAVSGELSGEGIAIERGVWLAEWVGVGGGGAPGGRAQGAGMGVEDVTPGIALRWLRGVGVVRRRVQLRSKGVGALVRCGGGGGQAGGVNMGVSGGGVERIGGRARWRGKGAGAVLV